jgi:RimJ/RimL family protein N-acetyltransferase
MIVTERLTLRPIVLEDAPLLFALHNDAVVMRFINGGAPVTLEQVQADVQAKIGQCWVAFERDDFVGWFSLRSSSDHEYELGYRLHRHAWGRGLASEGSRALIRLGFTEWCAKRIWAQTMTVNAASRAVLERCGLCFVRAFFEDWGEVIAGSELGDVEYEVRRADWLAAS